MATQDCGERASQYALSMGDALALKRLVETFIESSLRRLQQQGKEPDRYEAEKTLYAVGLARCGLYVAALNWADRALTPVAQRSSHTHGETWDYPTLAMLKSELNALKAMEIKVS